MAFLKQDKKGASTYLRIVQSYRDGEGNSKHRTLYNMGKAEDYSPEALKKIGQSLYELGGGTIEELESKRLHEIGRYYYGFPLVVGELLKAYSLDRFLDGITRNKSLGFNLRESMTLLISERLHDPASKYSNYINQYDYIGLTELKLYQIYRTLDQLHDNQEEIKSLIYSKGRNLFNQKLDVVFYDVTTFYFESSRDDGFREPGFGKDGKIGNTIITFGLLIDQNKQPVGYEVYHGKQYEGHTFADAVSTLKKKYQIDKVICVADTGMMNQDNMLETINAEYEFIFGERLKNITKSKQDEILELAKYSTLKIQNEASGEIIPIQYYVTEYNGKKLITTYSEKRAAKDKAEREGKIEKAKTLLMNPELLKKKAKHHYLKQLGKTQYVIDEDKIKRSERFDGFMTIATNNKDLSIAEILNAYKQLYQIEQSFRTFKTFLETRPMFHWTKKRILGHLALCYITFTLLNYLQLKLKHKGTPQSENQIRHNLMRMAVSLIRQDEHEYYLRSKTEEGAKHIMKLLSIKELPDLTPREAMNQYVNMPMKG
jgi:transposase